MSKLISSPFNFKKLTTVLNNPFGSNFNKRRYYIYLLRNMNYIIKFEKEAPTAIEIIPYAALFTI